MTPITVFIYSYNRPLYLWVCLDSLYRYTKRPARFIFVDNASPDPMVREVVRGFDRRGMFHSIEWADENLPQRPRLTVEKHRHLLGDRFVHIETDVAIFDTDDCWLARMSAHIDADPLLYMLGSYIDKRDFITTDRAIQIAPHLSRQQRILLIKELSPERQLPDVPPQQQRLVSPFNPPGRLLMLRTEHIDTVGLGFADWKTSARAKAAGLHVGIATDVRHRHLSLLNLFDYPGYDTLAQMKFLGAAAATDGIGLAGVGERPVRD